MFLRLFPLNKEYRTVQMYHEVVKNENKGQVWFPAIFVTD